MVREHCAREVGRARCSSCPSCSSGVSASRTSAPSIPHRVTYHPTCHGLRGLRLGDAPLRLLRAVRGIELVELPAAEECCGFGGTFAVKNADTSSAMLADKLRHVVDTRRRGLHRRRQLVPDAHRRRPLALRRRASGRSTSPRSSPPPSRSRSREAVPGGGARGARATRSCARNLRHATHAIRDKRARAVGRAARLGGAARGRARRSRSARCAGSTATSCSSRRRCRRAAARSTGRATPPRRTRSSPASRASHGVDRGGEGQVAGHRRDRAERRAGGGRHQRDRDGPGRADHPARRRLAVAHPRAGDPPGPRARSATSSARTCPRPPS